MIDPHRGEWIGAELRPVASWARVPGEAGRPRLTMIWAVPDPLPPAEPRSMSDESVGRRATIRAAEASTLE